MDHTVKYVDEIKLKVEHGKEITTAEAVIFRINQLCEEQQINILSLSQLAKVSQSTINEIMQGRSKHPRIITIRKIANGLGMTLAEFFDDDIFNGTDLDEERANRPKN